MLFGFYSVLGLFAAPVTVGPDDLTPESCSLINELTLAMIKPHAIKVPPTLQGIRRIILDNGFLIVRSKRMTMSADMAERFYGEHREKFFYNRLITQMVSGSSEMYILAKHNAIVVWRELMGPTKVYKSKLSHPDTIRGKFGITDTRNATHGSDSEESTRRELQIVFPEFDYDRWYAEEELDFRANNVTYDKREFIHRRKINSKSL